MSAEALAKGDYSDCGKICVRSLEEWQALGVDSKTLRLIDSETA